jgi:hypothetical protein
MNRLRATADGVVEIKPRTDPMTSDRGLWAAHGLLLFAMQAGAPFQAGSRAVRTGATGLQEIWMDRRPDLKVAHGLGPARAFMIKWHSLAQRGRVRHRNRKAHHRIEADVMLVTELPRKAHNRVAFVPAECLVLVCFVPLQATHVVFGSAGEPEHQAEQLDPTVNSNAERPWLCECALRPGAREQRQYAGEGEAKARAVHSVDASGSVPVSP